MDQTAILKAKLPLQLESGGDLETSKVPVHLGSGGDLEDTGRDLCLADGDDHHAEAHGQRQEVSLEDDVTGQVSISRCHQNRDREIDAQVEEVEVIVDGERLVGKLDPRVPTFALG